MKLACIFCALFLVLVGVAPALDSPAIGATEQAAPAMKLAVAADRDTAARANRSGSRTPLAVADTAIAYTTISDAAVPAPTSTTTTAPPTTTTTPPTTAPTTAAPKTHSIAKSQAATTTTTTVVEDLPTSNAGGQEGVVQAAREQVGKAYRAGATGPSAFDCSGLVFYVFNQAGVTVPRLTSDGYFAQSTHISRAELQPGDLIVSRGHIGIYIGGGQMVHASTPRGGVKISPIDAPGKPVGYGRL